MAQSIRISDDMYARAQQVSGVLDRSLAQQFEYWARLGAAIDAAGITSEQAMHLLAGAESAAPLLAATGLGTGGGGSAIVEGWHRQLASEVATGRRTAASLVVFAPEAVQRSTVLYVAEPHPDKEDAGW